MLLASSCVIGFVIFFHIYALVLESFLWTKPAGLRVFRQTLAQAEASKTLALNQGLYNGFLAAGLLWALLQPVPEFAFQLKVFFLVCVVAAGALGGATVGRKIAYLQAGPAILALALLFLAGR
jgi:putative membrane protein